MRLNSNEAYAFGSCADCTTVAVAFQVVLVVGQTDVAVPQNLSAAVNYACLECLTYALATQLVVTLDGPLSAAGMAELAELWQELARFGEEIEGVPLSELQDRLTGYEQLILDIIERDAATDASADGPATGPDGETTSPSPSPSGDTASSEPTASPSPSATEASPSGSPTSEPTDPASSSATPSEPTTAPTNPSEATPTQP
jgi:putative peptide zinc metalloprotease protein